MKLMEEINNQGTTVVVVTHNLEIVKAMNKRVITMRKGVIVSDSNAPDAGLDYDWDKDHDTDSDDGGDYGYED